MPEPPPSDRRARQTERVHEGQIAFNRGDFFLAHERWEEVWHELAGAERVAVQGLIQIAAGLHHLKEGRGGPAARLLEKGARKLAPDESPAPLLAGLRVGALLREVARLLAELRARPGVVPELSGVEV
jgi:predicted metal-dependent hydrolase